jgi:peptide/nickel transport system substrate-binding protein/oligopeptide transport system substrate-binding protein
MRRLLLLTALLAACRGGDANPDRHSIVDSRDTYDPRSLDPALSTDVPTGRAVAYLFDGLTRFTPDARVVPALATRWETSPDGRTYTFHLHGGVKFHDGRPLTARSVVATFRRVLAPGSTAGRTWPLLPIEGAADYVAGKTKTLGVAAVDDSTVRITLAEPLTIFPKFLAMPVASIVPDSVGADFGQHPVGSGPWKFVEWKHDDYLKFARNPTYFGGAATVDTLIARIIPEPSTAQAEFESGNVDILQVPEGETRTWEQTDEKSARLQSAPALRLYYMAINTTRGPLADVRVRRAINHAIDTKTILDRLISGRGRVAAGVIPPALDSSGAQRAPYAYDTAAARRLLAEAGHPNGIDVELWVSQDATFARLAQTIQGYLQAVGIRAKIVQRDASSVREASRNGQVDLTVKDWWADYPDADAFLYPLMHSSSKGPGGNVSFFSNRTVDSLITLARRTTDDAQRVGYARQADSVVFAEAPMAFLFFYNELYSVQPWVKGFQVPSIFNGQPLAGVKLETTGTR